MSTVTERVQAVVVKCLGLEQAQIHPDASFTNDLGADSRNIVELIMLIEDEFNIEIPNKDAAFISTIQGAADYLTRKGVK